jgi:hypothetical protein
MKRPKKYKKAQRRKQRKMGRKCSRKNLCRNRIGSSSITDFPGKRLQKKKKKERKREKGFQPFFFLNPTLFTFCLWLLILRSNKKTLSLKGGKRAI